MDTLTPEQRSVRMSKVRPTDTKPEWLVRRLAYGLGYRYRLHVRELPGTPDLVFRRSRRVIFVHGCFWHRHRSRRCRLARLPKSQVSFWLTKLEANRSRDARNARALRRAGWSVLTVWECELSDSSKVERRIQRFLVAS